MNKQPVKGGRKQKKAYIKKMDSKLHGKTMLFLMQHDRIGDTNLVFKEKR